MSVAVALMATTTGAAAKLLLLSSASSAQSGGRRFGRRWGDKQAQEHRGRGRVLCSSAPASARCEQRRVMHRRRAGTATAWSDPGNIDRIQKGPKVGPSRWDPRKIWISLYRRYDCVLIIIIMVIISFLVLLVLLALMPLLIYYYYYYWSNTIIVIVIILGIHI